MKYILITISVVAITLIFALSGLVSGEGEVQYLRIHIRANSNSEIDQAVKYKVKDEVVEALIPVLADIESFDEATKVISQNFAMIEEVANGVLEENGFTYKSSARIANEYFPTRTYQTVTLEEGYYDALILNLGSGKGDNWWCIVFPAFCFTETKKSDNIVYVSQIWEIIKSVFS